MTEHEQSAQKNGGAAHVRAVASLKALNVDYGAKQACSPNGHPRYPLEEYRRELRQSQLVDSHTRRTRRLLEAICFISGTVLRLSFLLRFVQVEEAEDVHQHESPDGEDDTRSATLLALKYQQQKQQVPLSRNVG